MKEVDLFAFFFLILMLLYTWIKAREKTHETIKNEFKKILDYDKEQDENDLICESIYLNNENVEDFNLKRNETIQQKKINILLFSVHLTVDMISFNVFMLAIFIMIILQIFQTIVFAIKNNTLNEQIEKFNIFKNVENYVKKKKERQEKGYSNEEKQEDKEEGEEGDKKEGEEEKKTFFQKISEDRYFTNKLVNNETLGNKRVFDIIYEFSMSLRIALLTYLFNYGFTQLYTKFIVKRDGILNEDAIHMHADIILFIVFINFIIMILLSTQI